MSDPISALCREIEEDLFDEPDVRQAEEEMNGAVAAWWLWWLN
jgi:hypothetical protein